MGISTENISRHPPVASKKLSLETHNRKLVGLWSVALALLIMGCSKGDFVDRLFYRGSDQDLMRNNPGYVYIKKIEAATAQANAISTAEANEPKAIATQEPNESIESTSVTADITKPKCGKIGKVDGHLGFLKRWRWRSRQKQLLKALAKLAEKIRTLERQIEFVDIPRARNKKWNP